jgi:hypothetical protein
LHFAARRYDRIFDTEGTEENDGESATCGAVAFKPPALPVKQRREGWRTRKFNIEINFKRESTGNIAYAVKVNCAQR